jgi:hypothetical protein
VFGSKAVLAVDVDVLGLLAQSATECVVAAVGWDHEAASVEVDQDWG